MSTRHDQIVVTTAIETTAMATTTMVTTTMVTTAMVLAAGRGERMRPLSEVLPKPALPLPNGPLVASSLQLAAALAEQVVVNTWHLADQMEQALTRVALGGSKLQISPEATLMGTAGGLALARYRGLLGGDPVLVLNGDVVLNLDLQPLLSHHHQHHNLITLALIPHPDPTAWSQVVCTDGQVTSFLPAGAAAVAQALLYPGAMLISQQLLKTLPVTTGDTMELLWQPALRQGRLGGAVVSGQWREVGTPTAYLNAVHSQLNGQCRIDEFATVANQATLDATFVGPDTLIEAGATVSASVISHGAIVRSGARITGSVLLGPVEATTDTTTTDQLLTHPLTNRCDR